MSEDKVVIVEILALSLLDIATALSKVSAEIPWLKGHRALASRARKFSSDFLDNYADEVEAEYRSKSSTIRVQLTPEDLREYEELASEVLSRMKPAVNAIVRACMSYVSSPAPGSDGETNIQRNIRGFLKKYGVNPPALERALPNVADDEELDL